MRTATSHGQHSKGRQPQKHNVWKITPSGNTTSNRTNYCSNWPSLPTRTTAKCHPNNQSAAQHDNSTAQLSIVYTGTRQHDKGCCLAFDCVSKTAPSALRPIWQPISFRKTSQHAFSHMHQPCSTGAQEAHPMTEQQSLARGCSPINPQHQRLRETPAGFDSRTNSHPLPQCSQASSSTQSTCSPHDRAVKPGK